MSNSAKTYESYLQWMDQRGSVNPWFHTAVDGKAMWSIFLDAIDPSVRQHYTCNTCKDFVRQYGGLVEVNSEGQVKSLFWDENEAPDELRAAVWTLRVAVENAEISGIFYSDGLQVLGHPTTVVKGIWNHFATVVPAQVRALAGKVVARMGNVNGNFEQVLTCLQEYTVPSLDLAVQVLKTDALYRSNKCLTQGEWLLDAKKAYSGPRGRNKLRYLVANAPDGFCHPRTSMISTLLDDISAGLSFGDIKRRFDAKMHPLQYQRPTAELSDGQIDAAEKLFAEKGMANSVKRRFARLEEVRCFWTPPAMQAEAVGGVFGSLRPQAQTPGLALPETKISWRAFKETILPKAESITFTPAGGNLPFVTMTTATFPDAPPILQWDVENDRYPVAHYMHMFDASADSFNLRAGHPVTVTGICHPASDDKRVFCLLEGCVDTTNIAALGLFPETLKAEIRSARRVVEKLSNETFLTGREEASACGIEVGVHEGVGVFTVKTGALTQVFNIDRMN